MTQSKIKILNKIISLSILFIILPTLLGLAIYWNYTGSYDDWKRGVIHPDVSYKYSYLLFQYQNNTVDKIINDTLIFKIESISSQEPTILSVTITSDGHIYQNQKVDTTQYNYPFFYNGSVEFTENYNCSKYSWITHVEYLGQIMQNITFIGYNYEYNLSQYGQLNLIQISYHWRTIDF